MNIRPGNDSFKADHFPSPSVPPDNHTNDEPDTTARSLRHENRGRSVRPDTAPGLPILCVANAHMLAQAKRPTRWFESGGEADHEAMLGPDGRIATQPDNAAASATNPTQGVSHQAHPPLTGP
jgi:hypothetical protein